MLLIIIRVFVCS